MSTRATYLFIPKNRYQTQQCFYIHYDGYPEGAATYFLAMQKYKQTGQCDFHDSMFVRKDFDFASRFFKGNAFAEFTEGHSAHYDTEYRYTLNANGILKVLNKQDNKWKKIFQDNWYIFVNKYLNLTGHEKLYHFSDWELLNQHAEKIMSINEANEEICNLRNCAEFYFKEGCYKICLSVTENLISNQIKINSLRESNFYKDG